MRHVQSRIAAALFLGFVSVSPAAAATLFVSASGDDTNTCLTQADPCRTIQAAVDKAADGDQITVTSGTYDTPVRIQNRHCLTIEGVPGAQLVLPTAESPQGIVTIVASTLITIRNIRLTGNGPDDLRGGIRIVSSQEIALNSCTIEDFGGGGVGLGGSSTVRLSSVTIQRNRFHGVRVDGPGHAHITDSPAGPSVIQDNLFAGVILNFGGNVQFHREVIIRRNSVGVLGEGATVSHCCGGDPPLRLLDNQTGLSLRGGHLELRIGHIEGNTLAGIRLTGASGSFARFSGDRLVIRNNGTAGNPNSAAIVLTGSHLISSTPTSREIHREAFSFKTIRRHGSSTRWWKTTAPKGSAWRASQRLASSYPTRSETTGASICPVRQILSDRVTMPASSGCSAQGSINHRHRVRRARDSRASPSVLGFASQSARKEGPVSS